jgi:hypothetical protein
MKATLSAFLLPALFVSTVFACAAPALANDKPQYTYQDGVLQGFEREPSESLCVESLHVPGSVSASPVDYQREKISASTTGSASCADDYDIVFRVKSGGATYLLTPKGDMDRSESGLLTRALIPHNVLDHQAPQTPIKIRSDGRHFFVKIGDHESVYSVTREE